MRTRGSLRIIFVMVFLLHAAVRMRAATFVWTSPTNGPWSTPTNWLDDAVPISSNNTRLEFNSTASLLSTTNDLANDTVINSLVSTALSTNVDLRTLSATPSRIRFDGTTPFISHTGSGGGQLIIRIPLALDAETTISNLGSANLLNLLTNVDGLGPLRLAAGRVIISSPGVLRPTNGTVVQAAAELWVGDAAGTPRVQTTVTVESGGAVSLTPLGVGDAPLRLAGVGPAFSKTGALHTERSTLSAGNASASWTGPITLDAPATIATRDGTLTLNGGVNLNGHTLTTGDPTNGTGTVRVQTMGLSGTGGVTVNGGTLQVSASIFTGPILVNGATMQLTTSTNTGPILVNGGSLSLSASVFTAPILVQSNGVLSAALESDLDTDPNPFVLDNGSFSMGFLTLSAAHPFTLGPGGGRIIYSSGSVINAAISGPGMLRLGSSGSLTLNGLNSYVGGTEVSVGTVIVSADHELGAAGRPIILNGGSLSLESNFDLDPTRHITTVGGTISFKFDSVVGSPISGAGRLTLARRFDAVGGPVVTLIGTNTQNGLRISQLTAAAAGAANLGDPASTLELTTSSGLRGTLRLLASFDLGPQGTNIYDGNIDTGVHDMTISRPGIWKSLTKLGNGVLTLAASNSLSVQPSQTETQIEGGILRVAATGAVPFGGSVRLFNSSQLDLNGFNHTFTAINPGVGSVRLAGANLTLTGGGSIDEGVIGPGAVEVQQSGLVLRGPCSQTSTIVGTTNLTSVTPSLTIESNTALGVSGAPLTLIKGAQLSTFFGPDPIVVDATHNVTLDGGGGFSPSGELAIEGIVSGFGDVRVSGGGAFALGHPSNSFAGNIFVVNNGTLRVGNDRALGADTNVIQLGSVVFDGESFQVSGGTLQAGTNLTLPATRQIRLAGRSNNSGLNRLDSQDFTFTVDGVISETIGGGDLVKSGAGTLRLNGVNTISQKLVVQEGTLGGIGTVQNLRLESGTTLAPGNSIGTFHVANVIWPEGAQMAFELGGSGGLSDRLEVSGALTGDNEMPRLFVFSGTPELATYTLITGPDSGNLSTDFEQGDFTFTGLTGLDGTFSLDITGLKFTVTSLPGGGSGNDVTFELLSRTESGTTLRFMPSLTNRIYVLEFSENLAPAFWQVVSNATFTPTNGGQLIVDTNLIPAQRFYRLKITTQ